MSSWGRGRRTGSTGQRQWGVGGAGNTEHNAAQWQALTQDLFTVMQEEVRTEK